MYSKRVTRNPQRATRPTPHPTPAYLLKLFAFAQFDTDRIVSAESTRTRQYQISKTGQSGTN
jgi:hypothetical protein